MIESEEVPETDIHQLLKNSRYEAALVKIAMAKVQAEIKYL